MYKNSSNFIEIQQNSTKKRTSSTEATRVLMHRNTIANPLHQKENLDHDSQQLQPLHPLKQQQKMPQTQTNFKDKPYTQEEGRQSIASPTSKDQDYQSILLTRFLKEPRLPPSSNYIKKKKSLGARKPLNKLNHTTNEYKSNNEGQPIAKKTFKQPVISYRNQSEIMKKIFGNEQNYHQVKNLLKQEDKYQSTYNGMLQKQQDFQQKHQARLPSQDLTNPQAQQRTMSSPQGKSNMFYNERKTVDHIQAPDVEQIILARSQKTPKHEVPQVLPTGATEQVEKAIFDLQDVKNNYFQEKQQFDQKIQQIQNKQNATQTGFYQQTRTTTSGFMSAGQRPMTQGNFFKNQGLMNDNNVLKGDLEQVSKEELKERLVVAEAVMKKLFQRNKDLEDMLTNKVETPDKDTTKSSFTNPTTSEFKLPANEDCQGCVDLRKEMTGKENEMQEKINELHGQLLKKTEGASTSTHTEYLQQRLEETMTEAKRHFTSYINVRNQFNSFLESRLNQSQITGGTKGQKLQNDILQMLKKNLEAAETNLTHERQQIQTSFAKVQQMLNKKDDHIGKKDKKIQQLNEEIERRQFLEKKVQRYVKGLIQQNQKYQEFLEQLKNSSLDKTALEDFLRNVGVKDYDENEGESTENEQADDDDDDDDEDSVEVNDI